MSALQEQAVEMIYDLSDDNVGFLIEIIQRLMPKSAETKKAQILEGMRGFRHSEGWMKRGRRFRIICQRGLAQSRN